MKIIGITGMSGAGKSTFTEMLGENEKVGIIKIDDLVGEVKKKYFKAFLQPKENNTTENTRENPKLNNSAKRFFYQNRFMFGFLMKLRSFLIKPGFEKKINQYKKEGKELVVVDDWVIDSHKWLKPKISKTYIIRRKFIERRTGLKIRSALTTDELKVWDLPYSKRFVKTPEGAETVLNIGSLEELRTKAKEVCRQYIEPSFDEKYGVEEKDLLPIERGRSQYQKEEKKREEK